MMNLEDLRNLDINDVAAWPTAAKVVGAVLVGGIILAAGYFLLIEDKLEILKEEQRREQQLRQTFAAKKALAINLPAYLAQMKEMEQTFGVMLRQLPNKTEIPELLIDITQAGLGRGLQFVLFKPGAKRVHDFYAELPISLKVIGGYHQLGEFVSDLAALPRIVSLGDLAITRASKKKGGGASDVQILTMTATAKTYHYIDEEDREAARKKKQKTRTVR